MTNAVVLVKSEKDRDGGVASDFGYPRYPARYKMLGELVGTPVVYIVFLLGCGWGSLHITGTVLTHFPQVAGASGHGVCSFPQDDLVSRHDDHTGVGDRN
jgi:hypothetical protein